MPVGVIAIRMSHREACGRRLKILFYVHSISQAGSFSSFFFLFVTMVPLSSSIFPRLRLILFLLVSFTFICKTVPLYRLQKDITKALSFVYLRSTPHSLAFNDDERETK